MNELVAPQPGQWLQEQVYFGGDDFFKAMLKELAAAESHIDFETYIFSKDEFGAIVESHLIAAGRRGVKVRLLVDGIGAYGWIGRWHPELLQFVEVRIYHPVRWPGRRALTRFFSRLNRRNHRKVCLIDGRAAWVGSMNVTREHVRLLSDRKLSDAASSAWRDTGVRIEGTEVQLLNEAFEHVWRRSHRPDGKRDWFERFLRVNKTTRETLVRLNFTRRLRSQTERDLKRRLRTARERIWITNPYFAPSYQFLRLLIKARKRGVDVRLLIPRTSDVFFMRWVATSFYRPLLKGGVRVFEYLPTFLHAKSLAIDDWHTVGTSNMNRRSRRHDLEVDIVITHEKTKKILDEQFLRDLEYAEEVKTTDRSGRIWIERLGRLVASLFRPWI